ncbi:MAG TPA: MMPL family transporter, partial [Thermomicrobiaceae bacterium]|nr:MMPL family transporter [Thermomicrobiaceae bacterium]
MSSLLSTAGLARASARHPWRTIGIWVAIFLLAGFSAAVGLNLTNTMNFTNNPESIKGSNLLKEHIPSLQSATETVVIYSDTQTIDSPAFRAVVQKTSSDLAAMKGLIVSAPNYYQASAIGSPAAASMVSADHKATIIPVTFSKKQDDVTKAQTTSYLDTVDGESSGAIKVATVGNLSINQTFNDISSKDLQKAEVVGVPAALIILIVVFGALVAAGVPLILSVVAIVTALGLTAILGQVMDLSTYVENMITMIGLAVGIDYALFIVSRYREERQRGLPKLDAIAATGGTASKAVLFSGCTVVLGLAGMLLLPTTIFQSMGAGAVLVVIAAVVAMLTLVPALLSLIGDRVDWPRRRNYPNELVPAALDHEEVRRGFWGRAAHVVMARPIVSIILA